jgi:hypothetical protein
MTDQPSPETVRISTLLASGVCAEDDLRAAILYGKVKPVLFIEEVRQPFKKWAEDGSHSYDPIEDSDDGDGYELFNGEIYLADGTRTDLLEADFHLFTKAQDEEAGTTPLPLYSLVESVSLSDLIAKGAIKTSDVGLIAARGEGEKIPRTGVDATQRDSRASHWPWGNHTTALLGHLEAAAKRWWVNYDPGDPSTAPTNKDVSSWLQNERQVSAVSADAIAKMLRPEAIRTGPRT